MNILKKIFQCVCIHKWKQSYEEYVEFDDGVGEHTAMRRIWTCKRCGKVSYMRPPRNQLLR